MYRINVSGNDNLTRWNDVVEEHRHHILFVINYVKSELGWMFRRLYRAMSYRFVRNDVYRMELRGIARELGVSPSDVILYHLACEYFIESSTIVAQRKDDVVIFRGLKTVLDFFQDMFIEVEVYHGAQYKYTGMTIAGYTGFLYIKFPNNTHVSIEYVKKIEGFSFKECIIRYRLYGWMPGTMLRHVVDENNFSCENIVIHTLRNNRASLPFRVNVIDTERRHFRIEYKDIRLYKNRTLIQTFGDFVTPSIDVVNMLSLRKYVLQNDEKTINELYHYVFLYYKI